LKLQWLIPASYSENECVLAAIIKPIISPILKNSTGPGFGHYKKKYWIFNVIVRIGNTGKCWQCVYF
jgi:hypothetical protein